MTTPTQQWTLTSAGGRMVLTSHDPHQPGLSLTEEGAAGLSLALDALTERGTWLGRNWELTTGDGQLYRLLNDRAQTVLTFDAAGGRSLLCALDEALDQDT